MKVGIPKGLLYYKYSPFLHSFFSELGAEIVVSQDTNKEILDLGVKYCVDEACLPIKIFHGHTASIRDRCDIMVVPRIMQVEKREFICPKFCGLPEMVVNSIPDIPQVTMMPVYALSRRRLYYWAYNTGTLVTKDKRAIRRAFNIAVDKQKRYDTGINNRGFKIKIGLIGHPYNIYDSFINMDTVKKLNRLGAGVITEENLDESLINNEVKTLYKRPFWTFARKSYGAGSYLGVNKLVDGLVYISSFACGIDSVIIELLKDRIGDFPLLILKVDEHTGEAGIDTRLEAFVDMIERRG